MTTGALSPNKVFNWYVELTNHVFSNFFLSYKCNVWTNTEIWYMLMRENNNSMTQTKDMCLQKAKHLGFFLLFLTPNDIKKIWSVVLKFTYNFSDLLFCNVYILCQFLTKNLVSFWILINRLWLSCTSADLLSAAQPGPLLGYLALAFQILSAAENKMQFLATHLIKLSI